MTVFLGAEAMWFFDNGPVEMIKVKVFTYINVKLRRDTQGRSLYKLEKYLASGVFGRSWLGSLQRPEALLK